MSNYYDFNKYNDMRNLASQKGEENIFISSATNKEGKENIIDDLIIDDNTIYEIDQSCYEKMKKNRLIQRRGGDKI